MRAHVCAGGDPAAPSGASCVASVPAPLDVAVAAAPLTRDRRKQTAAAAPSDVAAASPGGAVGGGR